MWTIHRETLPVPPEPRGGARPCKILEDDIKTLRTPHLKFIVNHHFHQIFTNSKLGNFMNIWYCWSTFHDEDYSGYSHSCDYCKCVSYLARRSISQSVPQSSLWYGPEVGTCTSKSLLIWHQSEQCLIPLAPASPELVQYLPCIQLVVRHSTPGVRVRALDTDLQIRKSTQPYSRHAVGMRHWKPLPLPVDWYQPENDSLLKLVQLASSLKMKEVI